MAHNSTATPPTPSPRRCRWWRSSPRLTSGRASTTWCSVPGPVLPTTRRGTWCSAAL